MTTQDFYQRNAQQFFDDTVAVEMSPVRDRFTALLPAGARVLDAGCGSGRDAKAFFERGFEVEAFDASAELVALASAYSGLAIRQMRFQDLHAEARYDGIWCCASLLHVPLTELPSVMRKVATALKPGGVLYVSFKYGMGEREKQGRQFTDMNEAGLIKLAPELQVIDAWTSEDQRPDRVETWLNGLLKSKL